MWAGAAVSRGARSAPTTRWGHALKAVAGRVHHVVGVLAVAVLALMVIWAVEALL